MGLSRYCSIVALPLCDKPYPSILNFLAGRFPTISIEIWEKRILSGKVLDDNEEPISLSTPYEPLKRLRYFREVEQEPDIPFEERIIYQNKDILVADKPHFLPVTPGGPYVNECLLNRIRKKTGIHELAPIHRIDRETAGIVLFSTNPETSSLYHELFKFGKMKKTYFALSRIKEPPSKHEWTVENRLVKGQPWFRMRVTEGEINSRSEIKLISIQDDVGLFKLHPVTGKTHQLRIHISGLGFQILNDKYYPTLQPKSPDIFNKPLQLVARHLSFIDPVSNKPLVFDSNYSLDSSWEKKIESCCQ